ncbi:MAG: hypothetical protein H7246_10910, partial [Phycisphaerae bacterium]|nr:hypothetical protein [Saprospiraceae bacterium]
SCGSYSNPYDKIKQGVVFYPPDDFWKKDTSNYYFNQPLYSVKRLLNYDTTRPNRFLVRMHGLGCIFPELMHRDSFYKEGEIVDVQYRENDFSIKGNSWTCRFNTQKLDWEKVYLIKADIITRKYHIPGNFILGWLQMSVSLCVIALILYVWLAFHNRQKPSNPQPLGERLRQDAGIVFLAAALFFWAVIGLIRIEGNNSDISEIMTRMFSLTNNALFLLALPYFRHGISHFKKYSRTYLFAGSALIMISLLIMLSIAISPNQYKGEFKWFDVIYSSCVLGLMGWLLIASFWKRNLPGIALLAGIIAVGAIYAQVVPHLPAFNFAAGLFRHVCYYTTFVMFTTLLVALTFSWYNEEMVKEAIDETNTKFARMQELILNESAAIREKREALEKSVGDAELELAFAGLDFVSNMDTATRDELLMLRSRYISARREYHSGKIKSPDFYHERQGVAEGLLDMIKRLFVK